MRMRLKRALSAACGFLSTAVDLGIRLLGALLALLAEALFLFVTFTYFTHVRPTLFELYGEQQTMALTLVGIVIVINLLYNHISTMCTSPGMPPETLSDEQKAAQLRDPELQDYPIGRTHRYCRDCSRIKPMRAHHCSVCKRCVMKMDHHCPWVNNCVGFRNHKYFVLFVFYLWIGCLFFLFVNFEYTISAFTRRVQRNEGKNGAIGAPSEQHLVAVILASAALFATTMFLSWNIYLVATNQSTIEFYANKFGYNKGYENPFDLGVRSNVEAVFGPARYWWRLVLPSRAVPVGDGCSYPLHPAYKARSQLRIEQQNRRMDIL